MPTPIFAAYDDLSIYALGHSPESAIRRARREARTPTATFQTARVSPELAAQILRDGWNGMSQSFDVVDGWIIDTTRRQ